MVLFGGAVSPLVAVRVRALSPHARVFDYNPRAVVAVHRAAPVEFAVAAAHHLSAPLLHPQAAVLTQPAAAAPLPLSRTLFVLYALAALGAVQAQADVPLAVVRRFLQVDELCPGDAAQRVYDGALADGAVTGSHVLFVNVQLLRPAMLGLQVVSDFPEVRQLRPAGFHAAALRHAVASADAPHRCFHGLLEIKASVPRQRLETLTRNSKVKSTYQSSSGVVM